MSVLGGLFCSLIGLFVSLSIGLFIGLFIGNVAPAATVQAIHTEKGFYTEKGFLV